MTPSQPPLARSPAMGCMAFERSGHHPMYEEQERFDRELFAWMERNQIG